MNVLDRRKVFWKYKKHKGKQEKKLSSEYKMVPSVLKLHNLSGVGILNEQKLVLNHIRKKLSFRGVGSVSTEMHFILAGAIGLQHSVIAVMATFQGKRVLVTGGNRGIGKGVVIALAKLDAKVVALGRNKTDLDELAKKFPNVSPVICDVTDDRRKIEAALEPYQPFDCLVNNAGVAILETFLEFTDDALNKYAFLTLL
ncbi:unnamed protein product [Enterobius vermicularis]|uniref:Oxidoreductase n=1 Tax=Enterobius vermicularis TaxID=51028 RepID=A0A0N4VHY4_ENTVE|nr:unnamed protein product [Enterobius vermicularis]